jgi:hypothetical protein
MAYIRLKVVAVTLGVCLLFGCAYQIRNLFPETAPPDFFVTKTIPSTVRVITGTQSKGHAGTMLPQVLCRRLRKERVFERVICDSQEKRDETGLVMNVKLSEDFDIKLPREIVNALIGTATLFLTYPFLWDKYEYVLSADLTLTENGSTVRTYHAKSRLEVSHQLFADYFSALPGYMEVSTQATEHLVDLLIYQIATNPPAEDDSL